MNWSQVKFEVVGDKCDGPYIQLSLPVEAAIHQAWPSDYTWEQASGVCMCVSPATLKYDAAALLSGHNWDSE